jgi:hypothetical protein
VIFDDVADIEQGEPSSCCFVEPQNVHSLVNGGQVTPVSRHHAYCFTDQ